MGLLPNNTKQCLIDSVASPSEIPWQRLRRLGFSDLEQMLFFFLGNSCQYICPRFCERRVLSRRLGDHTLTNPPPTKLCVSGRARMGWGSCVDHPLVLLPKCIHTLIPSSQDAWDSAIIRSSPLPSSRSFSCSNGTRNVVNTAEPLSGVDSYGLSQNRSFVRSE